MLHVNIRLPSQYLIKMKRARAKAYYRVIRPHYLKPLTITVRPLCLMQKT